MFEKIPSVKDFIIYFIPGTLTVYFGVRILGIRDTAFLANLNLLEKGGDLIAVSVIFALIFGFLISQVQIILLKCLFSTISPTDKLDGKFTGEFRMEVAEKLRSEFNLPNASYFQIVEDSWAVDLCYSYILEKRKNESILHIDRLKNLSNLGIALPVPLMTAIWYFQIILAPSQVTTQFYNIVLVIVILTSYKIWYNFRKGWSRQIFITFLIN